MLKTIAFALLVFAGVNARATSLPISNDQLRQKGSATVELLSDQPASVAVRFDDPGWDSGLTVLPLAGQQFWDLSGDRVISADVENCSPDKQLRLTMHLYSGAREDKTLADVSTGIALNPGEKGTMNLRIPHRAIYGTPAGVRGPKVVDSGKLNGIDFYMTWPFGEKQKGLVDCKISNLRVTETPDRAAAVDPKTFFPFIDVYGQYIHGDWPAKIHSDADLKQARAKEDAELAVSKRPAEWDRFGGWAKGPQLKATGAFRTEKYKGKWYFVDPDGRLFISMGLDVLIAHTDATQTRDHDKWFSFPVTTPELPFTDWNLQKKYDTKDYEPAFYQTLAKRLEHWGINSIGDWGKPALIMLDRTPYTLQLTDYNHKLPRITGGKLKFYDVFDPVYINTMKTLVASAAEKNPAVTQSLTDPMCIGYFIDNELNFGNRGRQILGDDVLKSPATQAAKQEFVGDLKAKYTTIEKLNRAWETSYADWAALLNGTENVPDSKGYKTDSNIFFRKAVDQYFRLCRDAIKSVAPNRLYLGCRFISTDAVRKDLYEASKKYCDVLTVNVYAHGVANLGAEGLPDMPVLIGEFHVGVLDRGMFSSGIVNAGLTQEDRARAYTRFVQGALVHRNIVGTHWFQFRDQPLTGRWDGEGYEIGFVDVADTPYEELTRAAREVGENMYAYRLRGKLVNDMR